MHQNFGVKGSYSAKAVVIVKQGLLILLWQILDWYKNDAVLN